MLPVVDWYQHTITYSNPSEFTLSHNYTSAPLLYKYQSMLHNYTSLFNLYSNPSNNTFASLNLYSLWLNDYISYFVDFDLLNASMLLTPPSIDAPYYLKQNITDPTLEVNTLSLLENFLYLLADAGTNFYSSRIWEAMINDARKSATHPEHKQNWTKLSVLDCVNTYNSNFLSTNRNLIILMHSDDNRNGFKYGMEIGISTGEPQSWIGCPKHSNLNHCSELESVVSDIRNGRNWTIGQYGVAKECWTERTDEQCKLQFSTVILSIVIICNFVKALCMLLVFFQRDFYPLATIGDAIQSFMQEPDPCTCGICYAGIRYIVGQTKLHRPWHTGVPRPLKWRLEKYRWWRVASLTRWIASIGIISASLITTSGLLWSAVNSDRQSYGNTTMKNTWARGFGRANLGSVLPWMGFTQASLFEAVLLANTPQLLFSILYLVYNAIFTSILMGREWNQYAYYRKSLRVSDPAIGQRSTYWLHVPFQYGIPLMILSGLLHWLISQSLFLVRVEILPNSGSYSAYSAKSLTLTSTLSAVGYSTISIIFVLPVATLAVIGVAICGMQRFKYDMPAAGCCSAAISAACHPANIDNTATLRPLMWGEIDTVDESGIRHLSFSDGDVNAPREGILYAGYDTYATAEEVDLLN